MEFLIICLFRGIPSKVLFYWLKGQIIKYWTKVDFASFMVFNNHWTKWIRARKKYNRWQLARVLCPQKHVNISNFVRVFLSFFGCKEVVKGVCLHGWISWLCKIAERIKIWREIRWKLNPMPKLRALVGLITPPVRLFLRKE